MGKYGTYVLATDIYLQIVGHRANFTPRVIQKIGIVDKVDIVKIAVVPPTLRMVHIAPKGIAFTFPLKPTARDPITPSLMNVGGALREWCSNPTGGVIYLVISLRRIVGVMVPERHEDITG